MRAWTSLSSCSRDCLRIGGGRTLRCRIHHRSSRVPEAVAMALLMAALMAGLVALCMWYAPIVAGDMLWIGGE